MLDIRIPPPHPLISVSILSADFCLMQQECRDVLDRGADCLHLDVMDGHFAPNLTMGIDMVRALHKHFPDTFLDAHLMVERPDQFIEPFAQAGANLVSFHLEVCEPFKSNGFDPRKLIQRIHDLGMRAGMVINPPTPPDALAPLLDDLELVLIMSVFPGYSGQKFIPEVLAKARWLRERVKPHTRIEIDGGISPDTAPQAAAAGCDMFVAASAIFGAADRSAVIQRLHAARG